MQRQPTAAARGRPGNASWGSCRKAAGPSSPRWRGTDLLAELPDDVSFEAASTLPVAGITAIRALEVGGALLGRRVLVTGAAGGVGRLAIQLAHRAGAHVTGVVRNAERGAGLRELGADELITTLEPDGENFDLLLESVGGASLAAALTRVGRKRHRRRVRGLAPGAHVVRRLALLQPLRRQALRAARVRRARHAPRPACAT